MKLYILRHGTTHWNAVHRIQGQSDIPLDAAGEEIARQTGANLAASGIRFDLVYSSPLLRALRTAELAAPGTEILTDPRLRELSFGPYEGQVTWEMAEDPGCAFRYFKEDPLRYNQEVLRTAAISSRASSPGDPPESLTSLCRRTASFLTEVVEPLVRTSPDSRKILISGHGAMNRGLLMHMQKTEDLRTFWGRGLQANCGIYEITAEADRFGAVRYQVDETCRIFYDPEVIQNISGLL